jgi:DnaK suppressor protein
MAADADPQPLRYQARLADERRDAEAQLCELEAELGRIVEASEGANLDDEHDPEGATVAFERALVDTLRAAAQARIDAVMATEAALADGRYGYCTVCNAWIGDERLEALPMATCCVHCAATSGS